MSIDATNPVDNAYGPSNAQNLHSESQRITEKNAQTIHQKISVEVLKETMQAEKDAAGAVLDMLA